MAKFHYSCQLPLHVVVLLIIQPLVRRTMGLASLLMDQGSPLLVAYVLSESIEICSEALWSYFFLV
jgi:hypothetical protein